MNIHAFQQLHKISPWSLMDYQLALEMEIKRFPQCSRSLFHNGIFIRHKKERKGEKRKMCFRHKTSFSLIHLSLDGWHAMAREGIGEKSKKIAIRTFFFCVWFRKNGLEKVFLFLCNLKNYYRDEGRSEELSFSDVVLAGKFSSYLIKGWN